MVEIEIYITEYHSHILSPSCTYRPGAFNLKSKKLHQAAKSIVMRVAKSPGFQTGAEPVLKTFLHFLPQEETIYLSDSKSLGDVFRKWHCQSYIFMKTFM